MLGCQCCCCRLLEGIELYKEDWAAVAAHVGTRSQAACLMHFVRLPIEDAFIEDMAGWGPAAAAGGSSEKQQQHTVLPFQDDNNPVMSTVGFLAVLMGPKVAAAAAQRALQVRDRAHCLQHKLKAYTAANVLHHSTIVLCLLAAK